MNLLSSSSTPHTLSTRISEQQAIIDLANKKKSKLLDYNVQGKIDDDDYIKMLAQIKREIAKAEELLEEYESQQKSNEEFRKHIDTIRRRLLEAQRDAALGVVSKDFVDQYIDKIFVTPEPNGAIRLDIRIYTGDTTARYLDKLAARMEQMEASTTQREDEEAITSVCAVDIRAGQMNKKMIEAYENGMK